MPSPILTQKQAGQNMLDLKLRRLQELNARLAEDLERPRIPVSEACQSLLAHAKSTKDHMVPSIWGPIDKKEDPYTLQSTAGCCVAM
ncbi:Guanine nucleotide-binding protein subunit gamma [Neolecta irregularis DAH-3]|uniref:Guanine nucleotide-binding protein subunit gamma n=1 Tax=Neolecta irregularis (strain DAH-3) TaxID=1198029 RepID=A0A1U7LWG0_NEOID|nr:Guanine nucleotide-binding protein subunit gamma [Neolecta irregularis DAH-3]|eukprot:OLL26841.1 Guanine nucleotide-binding protein subunit gamma [Neolecta irregularis DAH-3]